MKPLGTDLSRPRPVGILASLCATGYTEGKQLQRIARMHCMAAVIECVGLSKTYGRRVAALNDVTLRIEQGSSFGLLGENGAGKSTLVRIIMGFLFPTAGPGL